MSNEANDSEKKRFRLVFKGEVEGDQHAAVVSGRLAALLKLDDKQMEVLFSGKAVVVKKSADEATAVRYRNAFKKAGARLRVIPFEAVSEQAAQCGEQGEGTTGLRLLPVGADLLDASERPEVVEVDVDTSHITVGSVFDLPTQTEDESSDNKTVPDVGHLTLADVGTDLLEVSRSGTEIVELEIDVDFSLAEVGSLLQEFSSESNDPVIPDVDFELAEPGSDLGATGATTKDNAPPPPYTSHLNLVEPQDQEAVDPSADGSEDK